MHGKKVCYIMERALSSPEKGILFWALSLLFFSFYVFERNLFFFFFYNLFLFSWVRRVPKKPFDPRYQAVTHFFFFFFFCENALKPNSKVSSGFEKTWAIWLIRYRFLVYSFTWDFWSFKQSYYLIIYFWLLLLLYLFN